MLVPTAQPLDIDAPTTVRRCGPCQMMGHVVSTVSKRLDGAVTCVRIDCDKYPALASKYKVQALPTLVLFKDGEPIDKVEVRGALSERVTAALQWTVMQASVTCCILLAIRRRGS